MSTKDRFTEAPPTRTFSILHDFLFHLTKQGVVMAQKTPEWVVFGWKRMSIGRDGGAARRAPNSQQAYPYSAPNVWQAR